MKPPEEFSIILGYAVAIFLISLGLAGLCFSIPYSGWVLFTGIVLVFIAADK